MHVISVKYVLAFYVIVSSFVVWSSLDSNFIIYLRLNSASWFLEEYGSDYTWLKCLMAMLVFYVILFSGDIL